MAVTKFFTAEARTAAAVSISEDVAALVAFGFVRHGGIPYPLEKF